MKRLDIIVEGQTEVEFVKNIISPMFCKDNVIVSPICIRTSQNGRGGFVNYEHLRNDIKKSLKSKSDDLVVTMLVDFFRIPYKKIPNYECWKHEQDHYRQVAKMEESIYNDIDDMRFIPYIQMHEFEALLFSSSKGFEKYWKANQLTGVLDVISQYDNPEDINTTPDGAPSKRLLKISPEYQKDIDGIIIAMEIGLEEILNKCPRFAKWIKMLSERLLG